jgi:glycine/D-amino acid oxidase-like deaminating enzyme
MQLDALAYLRRLATEHPESGVRCVQLTHVIDYDELARKRCWQWNLLPQFEALPLEEMSEDDKCDKGRYLSVVVNPGVFLPWMRKQLQDAGVKFQRNNTVKSLEELECFGHDILINASGLASRELQDVLDLEVTMDRTYATVVTSSYEDAFVCRRGSGGYTYIFGRGDGTAVVGGLSEPVSEEIRTPEDIRGIRHFVSFPPSLSGDKAN